ncbi:hypothetical protein AU152_gp79 [Mycobacterium phage Phlei]|uniref:Uncharacterized protein n=1 Tax=Mycobacterium phage Phlei TaxID=1690684 RepID=A0A0N9BDN8_9CAUD|nr:hypothetical protein AU152_gp79 [Mycobacterium phage Phlei]ALA48192.1 hypothetical protein [Mycobacterium phage Phlei]
MDTISKLENHRFRNCSDASGTVTGRKSSWVICSCGWRSARFELFDSERCNEAVERHLDNVLGVYEPF